MNTKADAIEVRRIVRKIKPMLAGKGPTIQSAVLADLTSLYLAGMAPTLRPWAREAFIKLVDDLVPASEREMFGDEGHPSK